VTWLLHLHPYDADCGPVARCCAAACWVRPYSSLACAGLDSVDEVWWLQLLLLVSWGFLYRCVVSSMLVVSYFCGLSRGLQMVLQSSWLRHCY